MTIVKSRCLTHVLIPGLLAGFASLAIAEDKAAQTPEPAAAAAARSELPAAPASGKDAKPLALPLQQLINAIRQNHCDKAEALLKQGVDPNQFDAFGYTPLTMASLDKRVQCMKSLLAHGADVDLASAGGWTPLIGAAMSGARPEVIDVLLAKGANINAQNQWGCTALYYATGYGSVQTVDHLLKRGAAVPGTTGECLTPLRLAELRGYPAVIERLKQAEKASAAEPAKATSGEKADTQRSGEQTAAKQD
jgi:hypothetical protein